MADAGADAVADAFAVVGVAAAAVVVFCPFAVSLCRARVERTTFSFFVPHCLALSSCGAKLVAPELLSKTEQ